MATKFSAPISGLNNGIFASADGTVNTSVSPLNIIADINQNPLAATLNGDANSVMNFTNMSTIFSDDFGGPSGIGSIDATRWDILQGGLGANPSGLYNPSGSSASLTQTAIGSGTTGISTVVSGSQLQVSMGTTNAAELWLLSRAYFTASQKIILTFSKSQNLLANSFFVGMVEVDPTTGVPIQNANNTAEFTNRAGAECATQATGPNYMIAQVLSDSSYSYDTVGAVNMVGTSFLSIANLEIDISPRELTICSENADSSASKSSTTIRLTNQAINGKKVYKLLMRFKNVSTPASSTIIYINKIMCQAKQELFINLEKGNGDLSPSKSLPVAITNTPNMSVSTLSGYGSGSTATGNGSTGGGTGLYTTAFNYLWSSSGASYQARDVTVSNSAGTGLLSIHGSPHSAAGTNFIIHRLTAAATTNGTSVKTTAGRLYGGQIANFSTNIRYLKFFNKASAPTVGTDTPILTFSLFPSTSINIKDVLTGEFGYYFSVGIAYAITGGLTDNDTTAIVANDVQVNLLYM